MKVLITGGAGFIGSFLSNTLLENNFHVLVYDNLFTGKRSFLPEHHPNLWFVRGDILDGNKMSGVFEEFQPDVLIHFAALHYIPYCNENPAETLRVNINGTQAVLDCCSRFLPSKLIFASTAAVYPISDKPNNESDFISPIDIYGISKHTGERLVKLFFDKWPLDSIILRLFNAYGPNETNPHLIPQLIEQMSLNGHTINLGNLEPKRDYIHVSDITQAVLSLINNNNNGPQLNIYNVGTGNEYSVKDILDTLENITGKKLTIHQEKSRMRKNDRMHLVADISKISKATNWKPKVNLIEGLQQLINLS